MMAPPPFSRMAFAPKSATRSEKLEPEKQVVFFLDTYTEFNNPEIGEAAVDLLDAAGYSVTLVPGQVCCGRPLISKGMLGRAKENAMRNVRALAPYAREGVKIVGLEPSCISALRDEYPDLLPDDPAAAVVAEAAILIEEFFVEENLRERLEFRPVTDRIVLHDIPGARMRTRSSVTTARRTAGNSTSSPMSLEIP